MNTLRLISPHLTPYLSITGLTGRTYTYRARYGDQPWPVVDLVMHRPKISGGSWLYVATDSEAGPIRKCNLLYVGSQTVDRMFRGDGMDGRNFHHEQMRNASSPMNMVRYLREGGKVHIHVISGPELASLAHSQPDWGDLRPLVAQPSKHLGYWFEQAILMETKNHWIWNTNGPDRQAVQVLKTIGWA